MPNISKLPDAQDIADGICSRTNPKNELIKTALLGFAKLHVEAALLKASKAHLSIDMDEYAFDKMGEKILTEEAEEYNVNSIITSYPLTNIK